MDGDLFQGNPYEQMDDLGGLPPLFLVQHPYSETFGKSRWAHPPIWPLILNDAIHPGSTTLA